MKKGVKIKYKVVEIFCVTPCPHGILQPPCGFGFNKPRGRLAVGSKGCARCEYFVGQDHEYVTCNYQKNTSKQTNIMKEKKYYISVVYWQGGEEETYLFNDLIEQGKYDECLLEASAYDDYWDKDLSDEEVTTCACRYPGDDLIVENDLYALVRNNSVGGTYDLKRRYTQEEFDKLDKEYDGALSKRLNR